MNQTYKTPKEMQRLSWLALASFVLAMMIVPCAVLAIPVGLFSGFAKSDFGVGVAITLAWGPGVAAFVTGLLGIWRVSTEWRNLKGAGFAWVGVVMGGLDCAFGLWVLWSGLTSPHEATHMLGMI